ncbi:hypothetical protein ACSNOI_19680 [Actinomadura kijaniata]|uniref:hypothetical protein n=1 Tax=Actinomadura kijaniata TaxID=46161 RepID=UPI003F194D91
MADHRPLFLAAGLAVGALGAFTLVGVDGQLRDTAVVSTAYQPAPTYPDRARYSASVVRVETWLLRRDRPYELWIARGPEPAYGHRVTIGELGYGERPRIASADWRRDGVRVRFTTGHEVGVPADKFLGGR